MWKSYFRPLATTVWPALFPPWQRATTSTWRGDEGGGQEETHVVLVDDVVEDLALALVAPLSTQDDSNFARRQRSHELKL